MEYCYTTDLVAMDLGSPEPKDRQTVFCLNLKMEDPESIVGKIMVEYNNSKAVS
jgi:hypothetical protein